MWHARASVVHGCLCVSTWAAKVVTTGAAADSLQMVFPDKRFYFKPLLLIQLTVTIVGGIIAAVSAMAVRATGFLHTGWWAYGLGYHCSSLLVGGLAPHGM